MPTLGMIRQFFSFIKNNVPVLIYPFLNYFIFENSPFQSSTKYFVLNHLYIPVYWTVIIEGFQ